MSIHYMMDLGTHCYYYFFQLLLWFVNHWMTPSPFCRPACLCVFERGQMDAVGEKQQKSRRSVDSIFFVVVVIVVFVVVFVVVGLFAAQQQGDRTTITVSLRSHLPN